MMNAAVRPRASMMALAGVSVASAAVIGAVPSMSQAATYAAAPVATAQHTTAVAAVTQFGAATPAADANPLEIYRTVIAKAQAAIEKLQKSAPKAEYPILNQLLTNQAALVNGVINGAVAGEWKQVEAPDFSSLGNQLKAILDGFDVAGTTIQTNLTKALEEQLPTLLDAVTTSLSNGDIEGAMNNLLMAVISPVYALIKPGVKGGATASLLQILNIPLNAGLIAAGAIPNADIANALSQPLKNTSKVLDVVLKNDFNYIGMGVISPVAGGLGGFGRGVQNVVDALGDNDLEAALTALIQAPAITLDGFLHGGYGPSIGGLVGFGDSLRVVSGGLLGGGLQIVGKDADGNRATIIPGTGWVLQRLQQDILKAITPAPPKKSVSADMATLVAAQSGQTASSTAAAAEAHGTSDTAPESDSAATETTDAATNGSSATDSATSSPSDSATPVTGSDTDSTTTGGENNPAAQVSTGTDQSAGAATQSNGTASSKDSSSGTASKSPSSGNPPSNGSSGNPASDSAASAGAAGGSSAS